MSRGSHRATVSGGARLFHRIFTRLGIQARPPRFEVEWYPYANLVHTIRLREDTAFVRVSDVLRHSPQGVLEAAAALLLARLYRRRAIWRKDTASLCSTQQPAGTSCACGGRTGGALLALRGARRILSNHCSCG